MIAWSRNQERARPLKDSFYRIQKLVILAISKSNIMAKEDFDFFSELNGREIFHYNGGPVYVEDFHQGNTCDVRTMSGQILKNVPVDELESPEPEDMDYV